MFNTYEELKAAVEHRRADVLTLEVDLGGEYSVEHEEAKKELAQAKAMHTMMGGAGFLADNLDTLEERVAETKPTPNTVFIQYRRLELGEWAALVSQAGLNPIDQYEKVLPKTFIGVYGQDPVQPDDMPDSEWVAPEPLSRDGALLSTKGNQGILPGGALNSVVQNFMAWQNSGGDVTIRPTKSGLV